MGKKTIACVLMFCLAREEFPVDTHVWRISKKLGWVPEKASRDAAYEHLNIRVPADVRQALASMIGSFTWPKVHCMAYVGASNRINPFQRRRACSVGSLMEVCDGLCLHDEKGEGGVMRWKRGGVRVGCGCRYDLHVLLVEHGKRCPRCASNGKPRKEVHGDCPLVNLKSLASELQDRKAA